MLQGKNVLLGISAGIAAYKSVVLCRELVKKGANVKVLMTPNSANFVTPLTLSTLSKNPVNLEYFDSKTGSWNSHVELAKWADFMLIAPATQNTISKMAHGTCDNLLLATYFSMNNPVYFAPAMDLDMFQHPSNQDNIKQLVRFGNILIPAEEGELASGLNGEGRMADLDNILAAIDIDTKSWQGKKVLITAGPTHEAIDPVRYIGNNSSGKMGYALAAAAQARGAQVTLISGPSSITPPNVETFVSIKSADELFKEVDSRFSDTDVCIMAAAVADFKSTEISKQKIKKNKQQSEIKLQPTIDVLKTMGSRKSSNQFLVGFALETENEKENAIKKLTAKNCDLLVLNSLNDKGSGFGTDTNLVTIFDKGNNAHRYELKSKLKVAEDILNLIEEKW
ncbi:MAG: bifunctional phosphopantothenoylcysteine decarboxylase/phosphopantothenate--cysteine ligase CoaBC [Vicingaceae bacterium]